MAGFNISLTLSLPALLIKMREGVGLVLCRVKEHPDAITRLDWVERA